MYLKLDHHYLGFFQPILTDMIFNALLSVKNCELKFVLLSFSRALQTSNFQNTE